jgi:hypothetical protein
MERPNTFAATTEANRAERDAKKARAFCPKGSTGVCWQFIAKAVQQWLAENHIRTIYLEPGSPWQNGLVESFHGRLRDECLNREPLWTLSEARVVMEDFRRRDNQIRPHRKLGYLSPAHFARQLTPSPAPVGLRPPSARDGQTTNQPLNIPNTHSDQLSKWLEKVSPNISKIIWEINVKRPAVINR